MRAGQLWSFGARLHSVRELRNAPTPGLNKLEYDFAEASLEQWWRRMVAGVGFAAVLLGSLFWAWSSERMRALEDRRSSVNQVARFWMAPPQNNPGTAAAYLVEQLSASPDIADPSLRWSLLQAMHTTKERFIFNHEGKNHEGKRESLLRLLVEPGGVRFAVVTPSSVAVRNAGTNTNAVIAEIKPNDSKFIRADVAWSRQLIAVATGSSIRVRRFGHDASERSYHFSNAKLVKFHPSGSAILALSPDGTACIWSVADDESRKWRTTLKAEADITDIGWSRDGTHIFGVTDLGNLAVWTYAAGGAVSKLPDIAAGMPPATPFKWQISISERGKWEETQIATWIDYWVPAEKKKSGAELVKTMHWRHSEKGFSGRSVAATKVSGMTFSGDGKTLGVRSHKSAYLVDTATGQRFAWLNGHNSYIRDIRFTADSEKLLTTSDDRSIGIWSRETGARLETLNGHSSAVNQVAVTDDDCHIVSLSDDETARIWKWAGLSNERIAAKSCDGKENLEKRAVTAISFSGDGDRVAVATADQMVRIWSTKTLDTMGEFRFAEGRKYGVLSLAFSPDSKWLAVGGGDTDNARVAASIEVRSALEPYSNVATIETGARGRARTVMFSPTRFRAGAARGYQLLAALGDGNAVIYDFDGRALVERPPLKHGSLPVTAAAWSPDGSKIATSHVKDGSKKIEPRACVWSVASKAEPLCKDLAADPFDVSWSRRGRQLAVAEGDAKIILWKDGKWVVTPGSRMLDDRYPVEIEFLGKDPIVVARLQDGTVLMRDLDLGRDVYTINPGAHPVTTFATSPDGTLIAIGDGDGVVRLMPMPAMRELLAEAKSALPRGMCDEERRRHQTRPMEDTGPRRSTEACAKPH